jgi:hypothetical protein
MKKQCKTCLYFERLYWHKCLSPKGEREPQKGGYCEVLTKALAMSNSKLSFGDPLYVFESFGCLLHRPNAAPTERADKEIPT